MVAPFKKRDLSHARVYGHWESLPAWDLLTPFARCILIAMLMDYRTGRNFIAMSDAEAARRGNCARATAARAIQELKDYGWIKVARVGKMWGRKEGRTSAYFLTLYPEEIGIPATKDFQKWRPKRAAM